MGDVATFMTFKAVRRYHVRDEAWRDTTLQVPSKDFEAVH
jgi:hypothetical protein